MRWISHRERMRTQMRGWALTWRAVRWDNGPCAFTIRHLAISLAVHFREQSERLNTITPC